jgi:RecJ-like exonuclease
MISIILDEKGYGSVVLPCCSQTHSGVVINFQKKIGKTIETHCKECHKKHAIRVLLENNRVYMRKEIYHDALLAKVDGVPVKIIDLSRTGVRFQYQQKRSLSHEVGDRVYIKIIFPRNKMGEIDFELEIKSVQKNVYGCQFCNAHSGTSAGKAVGFYLFSLA